MEVGQQADGEDRDDEPRDDREQDEVRVRRLPLGLYHKPDDGQPDGQREDQVKRVVPEDRRRVERDGQLQDRGVAHASEDGHAEEVDGVQYPARGEQVEDAVE